MAKDLVRNSKKYPEILRDEDTILAVSHSNTSNLFFDDCKQFDDDDDG
jgi:hypothetical protein